MQSLPRNAAEPDASLRRALDVILALAALLLASPVMLLIALAVRIDSPGPVFFSQVRLGRYGRHFLLHKFRKFPDGPSASSGPAVTLRDDPRLTRVGRWLERSKLDELPQFWNVLRGDMAIVGPRPEVLAFADCFTGPWAKVLDRKPGLFGPSQVLFRHEGALYPPGRDPHAFYREVLFPTKAQLDLGYYRNRTVWSDVGWMARGLAAVFGASGGQAPRLSDLTAERPPLPQDPRTERSAPSALTRPGLHG